MAILAVEVLEPRGFGRIRLHRVPDDSEASVIPFVPASLQPAARVRTDGSAAYRLLKALGFAHQRQVHLGSRVSMAACTASPRS